MRYVFGDYTLDTRCYELRRAGALIPQRPKVFHLLAYLLAQRDHIVPRQELCEHLWPHQFVSDTTLDACLAQARHAVGERKVVTVLVCTLANAAGWAERLQAEVLHQRMQAFFALVLKEVERYGGTLQRMLDDGVLVLFGAPLAHEDHARRAVLAALTLQQRLHASSSEQALPLGEPWAVCIGLHTGQVIIGHLGDDGRLTFTSAGDTTHLAAGLAQQGAPGTILVSEATARLVQDIVLVEAGPLMPSPGQSLPRRTYKILGLGPRRAPLLRHARRPFSPFAGRQLELATLRALLTRIEAGQGQVVSLVGEPGMGKTRLVYEFWHSLQRTQVTFLEGRCDSYGQATPYLPLQEIVRQACGVTDGEPPAAITARMHQHLQNLGMAAAEEAPYLLRLLDVLDATARLAGVSPQAIRIRTFAALHQLLLRQSQRQPLLVVVENLHWIDPTSQEFLVELVERLAGVPLLLLVTCRPGFRPPWMDKSYATQLTLPQLAPIDSRRVVQAVLTARPLPERLLQDILAKAAGNPLFLEELAWAVREHSDLRLTPEIPATLQAAEFLYETRFVPEGAYTFKHALTHEVAYSSLLQERRRALHARILEAIETFYSERLAYHAFRGEVWNKAVAYFRQAGAKALALSAYHETAVCFEQALEALQHLPESRDALEQAIDLRLDLRAALIPPGEFERLLAHLNEAETLAEVGEIAVQQSPPDVVQAECHYRQALAFAEELGMRPLQAHCHLGLGMLYVKVNRREQARAELSTAIELYRIMEMTFWLPQAEAALAQVIALR